MKYSYFSTFHNSNQEYIRFHTHKLTKIVTISGKSSWPELVGKRGEVATAKIEKENPNVNADVVPEGSSVGQDLRCDRVWVWVNKDGIVISTPHIG